MASPSAPAWKPLLAALAAMTVLAALSTNFMAPNRAVLLEKDGKGPAVSKKDGSALYSYLNKAAFTTPEEQRTLGAHLGVPEDKVQMMMKAFEEAEAHKPNFDVPYFSTFLYPSARRGTRGGLHNAAMNYEDHMRKLGQAVVNDMDGKVINKEQGIKLAQSLAKGIDSVFEQQKHEYQPTIHWGRPVSPQKAQALAKELEEGEEDVFNPGHAMAHRPTKKLGLAQERVLAKELESGEKQALWDEVHPHRAEMAEVPIKKADRAKLVKELEAGEAYAQLPNHGRPMPAQKEGLSPSQKLAAEKLEKELQGGIKAAYEADIKENTPVHSGTMWNNPRAFKVAKQEEQLAQELTAGEKFAAGNLNKEWGIKAAPKDLTAPQARNLGKYLQQGLKAVYPKVKVQKPKFLSKKGAEALVKEGVKDEYEEYRHDRVRPPKMVSANRGPALAKELHSTLKATQKSEGKYVKDYINHIKGIKPARRPIAVQMAQQQKNIKLANSLQEGITFYNKMKNEAQVKKQKQHKLLSWQQGKELARFLTPQKRINKGDAPALGYAV